MACLRSAGTHVLTTLADAAGYINWNYDFEGLRSSFPERLEKRGKRHGDRLTEHWQNNRLALSGQSEKKSPPQAREPRIAAHRPFDQTAWVQHVTPLRYTNGALQIIS